MENIPGDLDLQHAVPITVRENRVKNVHYTSSALTSNDVLTLYFKALPLQVKECGNIFCVILEYKSCFISRGSSQDFVRPRAGICDVESCKTLDTCTL